MSLGFLYHPNPEEQTLQFSCIVIRHKKALYRFITGHKGVPVLKWKARNNCGKTQQRSEAIILHSTKWHKASP